jgi:hypothetical protein
MSSNFQHDYNRETGQGLRKALQHAQIIIYEIFKALVLFTHEMVKMALGK